MNEYGQRAVSAVVNGIIAGLIVGILVFIVSVFIPNIELPAALVGFWVGVVVALLTLVGGLGTWPDRRV